MIVVVTDDWPHNFDGLAKDLSIPSNTLRRYFKLFQQFIPNKLVKRAVRFNQEAKQLFENINKMYAQRMTTEEILQELAATRKPTLDVRPSSAPAQAMDLKSLPALPDTLAALIPLAERFLTAYERQTKALEDIAAALAHNRPFQGGDKPEGINPHPDHQTGQDKPVVVDKAALVREVLRLKGLGYGAARIRTTMVKAGWPSFAGPGHRISKSTIAKIIKSNGGDIQ